MTFEGEVGQVSETVHELLCSPGACMGADAHRCVGELIIRSALIICVSEFADLMKSIGEAIDSPFTPESYIPGLSYVLGIVSEKYSLGLGRLLPSPNVPYSNSN